MGLTPEAMGGHPDQVCWGGEGEPGAGGGAVGGREEGVLGVLVWERVSVVSRGWRRMWLRGLGGSCRKREVLRIGGGKLRWYWW